MKKNKSSSKSSTKASSKSATKESVNVTAHEGLVDALKNVEASKKATQSYLVEAATIIQEEQLSRTEVVLSLMEARGIDRKSAESQYSRMKKLFTDPKVLQQLKDGEIDLKTAREATKNSQKNKSPEVQKKNADKKFSTAVTTVINSCKILGTDLSTLLATIKAAAKKAGLK